MTKKLNDIFQEELVKNQVVREGLPTAIFHHKVIAEYKRGQYDNFIEQGFTEEQALFLVANEK